MMGRFVIIAIMAFLMCIFNHEANGTYMGGSIKYGETPHYGIYSWPYGTQSATARPTARPTATLTSPINYYNNVDEKYVRLVENYESLEEKLNGIYNEIERAEGSLRYLQACMSKLRIEKCDTKLDNETKMQNDAKVENESLIKRNSIKSNYPLNIMDLSDLNH